MDSHKNAPQRRSAFPPAHQAQRHERIGPTCTMETPLTIKAFGHFEDGLSKSYASQRTGFKLGKFALHIQGIEIRLKDESGPHGDPLCSCGIGITLEQEGEVVVERRQETAQAAFDLAINVAERTIRRILQRRRDLDRSSKEGCERSGAAWEPNYPFKPQ
jgi:ribosome-associated translation inhibitor RaiA